MLFYLQCFICKETVGYGPMPVLTKRWSCPVLTMARLRIAILSQYNTAAQMSSLIANTASHLITVDSKR